MKTFAYGILLVFVLICGVSPAAPEPAIVPSADLWTTDVTFEHPQQIEVKLAGQRRPKRFWYMIITLTNRTGKEVDFYHKCELMTDSFKITPAGKNVPKEVFDRIKARYQRKYPFLELLERTSSQVLQGIDNTKDIVIIWPDFDLEANNIKFFITGLSNETIAINHPVAKDKSGSPAKVYLRKTLELSYAIGGDPQFRSDVILIGKGKRWVMR